MRRRRAKRGKTFNVLGLRPLLAVFVVGLFATVLMVWFSAVSDPSDVAREERKHDGVVAGVESPTPSSTTGYPRLFAQYLVPTLANPNVVSALANWDWVSVSNRVPQAEVDALKAINPDIEIGRYFSATSYTDNGGVSTDSYTRELYNKVTANNGQWIMRDTIGEPVITWNPDGPWTSLGINMTSSAPPDENGDRFYDWYPQFLYDRIVAGVETDFLLSDEMYSDYTWLEGEYGNGQIDINNDTAADNDADVNAATQDGYRRIMTNLRQILADNGRADMRIVGNGVNLGSYYPLLLNGAMREDFPYMHGAADPSPNTPGYHWEENMFNQYYGYVAIEGDMLAPHFSFIAARSMCPGNNCDTFTPPDDANFHRHIRFSLGSTLLGDGYFGIANWSTAWWLADYYAYGGQKGYLGAPQTASNQIVVETRQGSSPYRYGVYTRQFANGVVYVNGSGYSQSVTLDGAYEKVPDGSSASETVTIPVWDALILVAPPNNPPVLASIGPKSTNENQLLSFSITATDDDPGADFVFSASNLPTGASLTDNGNGAAAFSWMPTASQAGTYANVQFSVSDGTDTDSETITITVNEASASCTPSWSCGEWSACSSGSQTRTCTDQGGCGTDVGKPAESQSCDTTPPKTVEDLRAP